MSLYNELFGFDDRAEMLLAALKLKVEKIPRFRDCYLRDNCIVVYTRTGGDNRYCYDNFASRQSRYAAWGDPQRAADYQGPWNDDLRKHPNYVTDVDCDFDNTYCYFFFSFPDDYKVDLRNLASESPSASPTEKWLTLMESMNNE